MLVATYGCARGERLSVPNSQNSQELVLVLAIAGELSLHTMYPGSTVPSFVTADAGDLEQSLFQARSRRKQHGVATMSVS